MFMGMLQNVVRSAMDQLGVPTTWLYSIAHGGLTYLGEVVVFAASLALAVVWDRRGDAVRERVTRRWKEYGL